jgi:hypothetical protein
VTASSAGAAETLGVLGLGQERDQTHGADPREETPQQSDHQAVVQPVAPLLVRPIHDVTVLSVITIVQLGWLTILGYVVFSFAS